MSKQQITCSYHSTVTISILLYLICITSVWGHGHSHDHAHSDEPASFKYSQQANEPVIKEHHGHGHEHSHDHIYEHGHDHVHGHEHSHGHGHAHGHEHSHNHHHGHAHGHHGHEHGQGHHHGHEPAPSKYSQQVNEPTVHEHSHEHSHSHEPNHYHGRKDTEKILSKRSTGIILWFEALSATAIISVSPVFILLFIPLENTEKHQPLLKVLLSFASGGLLGDAFLHLIPHAVSPHSHSGEHGHSHEHSHDHGHSVDEGGHSHDMSVGLWVLAGIIAFLIVEKFVRIVKGGHGHSHGPALASAKTESRGEKAEESPDDHNAADDGKDSNNTTKTGEEKDTSKANENKTEEDTKNEIGEKTDKKTDEVIKKEEPEEADVVEDIKVSGYLNLAADFAHNFTDGLAIGASFLMGQSLGIITTITIFLHEIPHEIGDFAILVQSGCTKKKAMMLQFSTAIGAMLGTICSLFAEGIGDAATAWILPFTAGGFIYIATVSVIPELLEDTKLGQSVKEIIALLIGVYMMVLIGQFE